MSIQAFVGHSFSEDDRQIVEYFLRVLKGFERLGLKWEDAEEAESTSVADKVTRKIKGKDLFVGIFTRKYLYDQKKELLSLGDYVLCRRGSRNPYLTSSWTLQESGFAIALRQKLVLLVEEGVVDVGGLQGDHEVILFSRSNPEKCLQKLHDQLSSILAETLPERGGDRTVTSAADRKESKKPGDISDSQLGDSRSGPSQRLITIIHAIDKKDFAEGERIFREWLNFAQSIDDKLDVRVWYACVRLNAGSTEAFKELEDIVVQYPDKAFPLGSLAYALKGMKQFEKAAELFVSTAEKESLDVMKARRLSAAADCLAQAGKVAKGYAILGPAINALGNDPEALFLVFKGLADLAGSAKDYHLEVGFLELAVDVRPAEHDARFELASKYNVMERYALALHHYLILSGTRGGAGDFNNAGVAYSNLGLAAKAVDAYKKASEKGATLADANIAYRYIEGGFFDEARTRLNKALEGEDCHANVNSALANIDESRKKESEREKQWLESLREEIAFRRAFAGATLKKSIFPWSGNWNTTRGRVMLAVEGNQIVGEGMQRNGDGDLTSAMAARAHEKKRESVITIKISATPDGMTASGEWVTDDKGPGLLAAINSATYKLQLYVESERKIRAMLVSGKAHPLFETLERIS